MSMPKEMSTFRNDPDPPAAPRREDKVAEAASQSVEDRTEPNNGPANGARTNGVIRGMCIKKKLITESKKSYLRNQQQIN